MVRASVLGCPEPHLPPNHVSGLQDQGQGGSVPSKKPVLSEVQTGAGRAAELELMGEAELTAKVRAGG